MNYLLKQHQHQLAFVMCNEINMINTDSLRSLLLFYIPIVESKQKNNYSVSNKIWNIITATTRFDLSIRIQNTEHLFRSAKTRKKIQEHDSFVFKINFSPCYHINTLTFPKMSTKQRGSV